MTIWAIGDLHLATTLPEKKMDFFEGDWIDYTNKMEKGWKSCVQEDDLVLIPGDISWALKLPQAIGDLEWIDRLPGTKVMIKGNHDHWWGSLSQVKAILPPSIHVVQNDVFQWKEWEIGGARLWDTPEYNFNHAIEFRENPRQREKKEDPRETERIFTRELSRLEMSLKQMKGDRRIAMVHYPPLSSDLEDSRASKILEKYKINVCVFGHLHQVKKNFLPFGEKNGVKYILTSSDYIDFKPVKI